MHKFTSTCFLFALAMVLTIGEAAANERYRVMAGDNLYRIGRKFGVHYREIMTANRLSKTTIYPNQILLIPHRKAKPPTPVQRPAVVARAVPQAPTSRSTPVDEYAGAAPRIQTRGNPYQKSTTPRDPVKPFVIANKLPKAAPITNEEDPLGLGYNPGSRQKPPAIKAQPVEPRVIAHKIPKQQAAPLVAQKPPRRFPRTREVPAVAHYPGKPGSDYALDPQKFPTPSFTNPCTPKPSKKKPFTTSSSGMRSYTVRSGDSVWSISRKFGVAPLKLRQTNGILFSRLRPGMCLTIPPSHGIWAY